MSLYLNDGILLTLLSQDMSAYVKKIQFKLHESYVNPLRGQTKFIKTLFISVQYICFPPYKSHKTTVG